MQTNIENIKYYKKCDDINPQFYEKKKKNENIKDLQKGEWEQNNMPFIVSLTFLVINVSKEKLIMLGILIP